MATSFQARLAAKQNKLSQKLIGNSIRLSGTITDVIRIKAVRTMQQDLVSRTVEDLEVIEMIFPAMANIPMHRFIKNGASYQAVFAKEENVEPFKCFIPSTYQIDQDDIVVKFFDNPAGDEPWLLILQVKDSFGVFGARSIIWSAVSLTYYDELLPEQLIQYCRDIANRRKDLRW